MSLKDRITFAYRSLCYFCGDHSTKLIVAILLVLAFVIGWQASLATVLALALITFILKNVPLDDDNDDWWNGPRSA